MYFGGQVVLFILALGLISMVFTLSGGAFMFQLGYVCLYLAASVATLMGIYRSSSWAVPLYIVIVLATLLEVIYLDTMVQGSLPTVFVVVIAGLVGFFGGIFNLESQAKAKEEYIEIPFNGKIEAQEENSEQPATRKVTVYGSPKQTNFSPGRFVASQTGTKYHIPKCNWAKKINKKKMVWFENHDQAMELGYKKCECLF